MTIAANGQAQILAMLNNYGLAGKLSALGMTAINQLAQQIGGERPEPQYDVRTLLGSVGPPAAAAAMDFCINHCRSKGQYQHTQFTTNHEVNLDLVMNDEPGFRVFQDTMRQFLLPRYAFYNLDAMVDPRHQVDAECGYPRFITPIMYRLMYDRDDISRRVVDIYPDESFAVDPAVYDDEDPNVTTAFKEDYQMLCDDFNLIQHMHRIDRLSGIGHYGILLLGLDDGQPLDQPINEPDLLKGVKRSVAKKKRNLLYLRPFDEYLSYVQVFETDTASPRCGMPLYYNLVFIDMSIDAAGASVGTRINRRVHWSRVVHVTDNMLTSPTFHCPRMQPVFNRLLDLRKIKGSSAEAMWKGGFPGLNFKIDPRFVADRPEYDEKKFREEIREYLDGLDRAIKTVGIEVSAIQTQVADPSKHIQIQMDAISCHMGVPGRIFMGAEESRLASSQDKLTWNQRLYRRLRTTTEPNLVRNLMDRLVAVGVMNPPKNNKYFVGWNDLNTVTDEDKANLALKWTQALSQYVATGIIHLIDVMDFLTLIMGIRPSEAKRISDYCTSSGGLSKLKDVDPSQGAGQNGVRQNIAGKASQQDNQNDQARMAGQDKADRQANGMKG